MSIENYSVKELFTRQLDAIQVFPRLYLVLIKIISQPFDYHLMALRLPSFMCMILGFFCWLKIARYEFKDNLHYLTFVCSWTASGMLLYYSAELKQYSMDVLTGAVFLLFLYHQQMWQNQRRGRLYTLLLILLPALCLFSYTAFMFAPLPLFNLILSAKNDKRCFKDIFIYSFTFVIVILLFYFFDMRLRPAQDLTSGFENYFISFASAGDFFTRFGEGVNNLFSRWFVEKPRYFKVLTRCFTGFGLIYLFYGFFSRIKKDKWRLVSLDTIAFVLFVESFLLGALQKYPFTVPRTSLFFCPIVLYLTIKGIAGAKCIHPYFYRILHNLYLVFLIFLTVIHSCLAFSGQLSYVPTLW